MRHYNRGEALAERRQRSVDLGLGSGVHRAGCLVQHQNGCVVQQSARDCQSLDLAAAELRADLADVGVLAVRHGEDLVVNAGGTTRRIHFVMQRFHPGVANVVHDGRVKHPGMLRHDGHKIAQRRQRHVAHVVPVNADDSILRVVEALPTGSWRA